MEEKSKVMDKWQTVIPKRIRDAADIAVGDLLKWKYEDGVIMITPPKKISNPSETLYGLISLSDKNAVEEIKKIREERLEKILP